MSAVEQFEAQLRLMLKRAAPGAAKGSIANIRNICTENVQSEQAFAEKLRDHFQSTPSSHKLGVIYALDAILRVWFVNAQNSGQLIFPAAAHGSFAGGVNTMTQLAPSLVKDTIQTTPPQFKERIEKLIDIWAKDRVFVVDMIEDFRRQLTERFSPSKLEPVSYTPPGSPKASIAQPQQQAPATQTGGPANALLASLTSTGFPSSTTSMPQIPQIPAPLPQNTMPPSQPPHAMATVPVPTFAPPAPASNGQVAPQAPANQAVNTQVLQQQLLQALISGQVPPDQIPQVCTALGLQGMLQPQARPTAAGTAPMNLPLPNAIQPQGGVSEGTNGAQARGRRDREQYDRDRERSRSPDYKRRRTTPMNRRDSPDYGKYDPSAANNDSTQSTHHERRDRRGRSRANGRQRTPRNEYQTAIKAEPQQDRPKFVGHDDTLPSGHVKVLSRTLFVGGVNASSSEAELRAAFSRFGPVQSCIVNPDKRHAFVKMETREGAVAAKNSLDGNEDNQLLEVFRQTRWGVGFGRRECMNYDTGISVIPISSLTEADLRWVHTAEFGGTGGLPLDSGMVIEEPDIEIGAGVSSKAISRKVDPGYPQRKADPGYGQRKTDPGYGQRKSDSGYGHQGDKRHGFRGELGGGRGGKSKRDRHSHGYGNQYQNHQYQQQGPPRHHQGPPRPRYDPAAPEPNTVGVPPAVPGFGFQFPGLPTNYN